jgi:hypothetical protein
MHAYSFISRFHGIKTVAEEYTLAVSAIFAPNARSKKRFHGINMFLGNGRARIVQQMLHASLFILLAVL